MKKIITLFIIFLLSMNLVLAGRIYNIDFSDLSVKTISISERDVVRFSWGEKEHKIKVNKISSEGADLVIFIEGSTLPYYVSVNEGKSVNLDFDRDRIDDMKVGAIELGDNEVNLAFIPLVKESDNISKKTISEVGMNSLIGWGILVGIIVIGLVGYLIIRKK